MRVYQARKTGCWRPPMHPSSRKKPIPINVDQVVDNRSEMFSIRYHEYTLLQPPVRDKAEVDNQQNDKEPGQFIRNERKYNVECSMHFEHTLDGFSLPSHSSSVWLAAAAQPSPRAPNEFSSNYILLMARKQCSRQRDGRKHVKLISDVFPSIYK